MCFSKLNAFLLTAFLFVATALSSEASEPDKSQMDVATCHVKLDTPNAFRILYIGDSITLHGTNAAVKSKLKWDHVAGMAASEDSKDYAHLFAALIQETLPDRSVEIYYHTLGGSGAIAERLAAIDQIRGVEPHLVVIQLGEHEKVEDGIETLRRNFDKLLKAFNSQKPPPRVLCVGPWSPPTVSGKSSYKGWTGQVQQVMQECCNSQRIPFVSVQDFAENPDCRGWGESVGVQWHPNDKGHEGYARKLLDAYKSFPGPSAIFK
ncbi:MAG: SGNH/GDSL hydrolase family protein [Chthoniobacteraceae bacterium]